MSKEDTLVAGRMLVYPAEAALMNSILTTAKLNDAIRQLEAADSKLRRQIKMRLSLDAEVMKRRARRLRSNDTKVLNN